MGIMTKKELDREIGNYYDRFLGIAREYCRKNCRKYSPEDCVSALYLHLEAKVEKIDIFGFYGYCSNWLRFNISKPRTALNLQEIKIFTFFDKEIGIEGETEGSAIDKLKEELKKERKKVKGKVNQIFLDEITGDRDYCRKSIAELYRRE